ncbi:MAG: ABC transporter permease [Clostridiales Family XIII bacterium]|jgi:hypothetical protein|nr:ABC transporter permease [Clostridiales Family XIII bacterium]
MMGLFLKECRAVRKTIPWFLFVVIVVVFYFMNFGFDLYNQIRQVDTGEEIEFSFPAKDGFTVFSYNYAPETNPLISPSQGDPESYGRENVVIPELTMPNACAMLATEYMYSAGAGRYTHYSTLGFLKHTTPPSDDQNEIAGILVDMTGLSPAEIGESIKGLDTPIPFATNSDEDYGSKIPIKISYEEFERYMRRVDQLIGGGSPYAEKNLMLFASRPAGYEDRLAEYRSIVYEDKITNAYARYFCDYMGIVIALFAIFVVVNYMTRDRRARGDELIMPRRVSSLKLIVAKYLACVVMTLLPIIIISIIPTIELIVFARGHGLPVDPLAFLKYEAAWLLPTLLTVTSVGFAITILTDTPAAIIVQFVWSYITLIVTPLDALGGPFGTGLIVRFNTIGGRGALAGSMGDLAVNRVMYSVLAVALLLLSAYLYSQKRKGRIDVIGKIRYVFRIDRNPVQDRSL